MTETTIPTPLYQRRIAPQTVAWFNDLRTRGLLNLSPPFQRRSVWSTSYKQFFIETVLLGYPCPPIFLHEAMSAEGVASYAVVDGKQRLTSLFEFIESIFAVDDSSALQGLQGHYFDNLEESSRLAIWRYQLIVEFVPTRDQGTLDNIFDRINRNVARLTRQELRHARFSGDFAASAESLSIQMDDELPRGVPRIAPSSKRQMKDIELVAQLLLLIESGPESFSQDELDEAYSERDGEWDERTSVERRFRAIVRLSAELLDYADGSLAGTRVRNQADFYSFVGALDEAADEKGALPRSHEDIARDLTIFFERANDEEERGNSRTLEDYYQAARSASNDLRRRETRIQHLVSVINGGSY